MSETGRIAIEIRLDELLDELLGELLDELLTRLLVLLSDPHLSSIGSLTVALVSIGG